MIPHRSLFGAASEALARVLTFEHPADTVVSRFFREQPRLGQKDRAFVAEAVFGVLRHKGVLDHVTDGGGPRRLVLGWLVRFGGVDPQTLRGVLQEGEAAWLREAAARSTEALPPQVQAELPDWVWERLAGRLGTADLLALGHALQQPAPLDLRVNTFRTDREAVLQALAASGIAAAPMPFSPVGVRLTGKPPINRHPLFRDGRVEVQDEGSQIVCQLVAPRRHDLVVDFCAGAGGKALMLAAAMHSQGRVYAFDVSSARLDRLGPRLRRSGLSNIHPQLLSGERDTKVKRLAGKIDRVLVDAPCSGLGTLRRNPDLKWRQSPASVAELRVKQAAILRAAATLVKPGGRLVYATCSLLEEENEAIVDAFLGDCPAFVPVSCAALLKPLASAMTVGERLRLWPHLHGTDGFFAAVMERRDP